jgi:hypothetical protein
MKHLALLAALAAFTLPAIGQNYDYCIKARRTDIGPYPPAGVRYRCGFVNKDPETTGCTIHWTSDSWTNPPSCYETGTYLMQQGCQVYNNDGPNLQNDLAYCDSARADVPGSKYFDFWKLATPDNGDGL